MFDIRESDSNAYGAVCSLYRMLLFTTTDWSAWHSRDFSICCLSKWGHVWTTSPELLWESLHEHLPFDLSKIIVISYTHRTVKVFAATPQNKSLVKLGRHYTLKEINYTLKAAALCIVFRCLLSHSFVNCSSLFRNIRSKDQKKPIHPHNQDKSVQKWTKEMDWNTRCKREGVLLVDL